MARPRRRQPRIGPRTNISRQPEGWSINVARGGEKFSDYCGDAVWGGRAQALVAAQRFRDELLERVAADTRVRRQPQKGRPSETGVVGVWSEPHVVGGRVYERYVASWQDPEKELRRRRFLVERYGRDRAFALAVEAREEGVAFADAQQRARQCEEAKRRLQKAPPMPRQVKDPLSRKGISMACRRPRRVK
jgi:hypothetical protein